MENTNGLQQGKSAEKICPCCGAKMKLHWHRLNKGLVNVLIKFRKQVIAKGKNEVQISELGLNTTEFCNFQKLRYHAMIAKCRDADGNRMGGYWLLTKRGNQFCKGLIEVPEKVGTFRNKIRKKSTNLVSISKVISNENLPTWDSIETMDFEIYTDADIEESLWEDEITFDESGQGKMKI
jgi:hypothetical protein